ncbi:MAG: T9SS type A sorting domain-containing protein, partial [Bacteroidales bacterium]|nr:T9SS type A sorting domain-containing protein [Bacteroidales bacterium]
FSASIFFTTGKRVQLLLSKTGPTYNDFFHNGETLAIDTVRETEYVQYKCYYKATETKMHFLALYDNSPASTVNLKIDRFVVVDSATAFLPNLSLNSIRSNDTGLVCDMTLPQDVSVSVTNNSFFARDTFLFLIKTDLYDTSVVVIGKVKEEETSTFTLRGIWHLSTAGTHFIEVSSANGNISTSRYVAAPYDLMLSSLNIDNSNSYAIKRGVSASIKSNTDSSLQNVRVAVAMNGSIVLEKTIDLVTPSETSFVFDDSLSLINAGNYHVAVFIVTPVPCNSNAFDDTVKTVLVKQDTLGVGVSDLDFGSCFVYPNPASDVVYVRTSYSDVRTIEVVDLRGRVVGSISGTGGVCGFGGDGYKENGVYTVSMRNLPAGIYVLKVTGARGSSSVKVVKK